MRPAQRPGSGSPSVNDARAAAQATFAVIGDPSSKRVELFQAALGRLGRPPARVVPYGDLIAGRAALGDVVRRGDVVRIDSPDQDFEVERALLALGAGVEDEDGEYARATRRAVGALAFDSGAIPVSRTFSSIWAASKRGSDSAVEDTTKTCFCFSSNPRSLSSRFMPS